MQNTYHVYASITIAQAILESQWGTSQLASQYHNLFGIKGRGTNSRVMTTKEYINGKWIVTKDDSAFMIVGVILLKTIRA